MNRITTADVREMKKRGQKIVMMTAYDYPTARLVDQKNMDFAQRSQVETIPDLRVVSPDGRIVGQEIGYGGPEEFYAFIDAAIRRAGK